MEWPMTDHAKDVWSGWRLIDVPEGVGGAEARHRQHLVSRRRHQLAVLELLGETHPELVCGERDVRVPLEVSQQWETHLQDGGGSSVVEIRNKINFLSLGLLRGQRELGWDVVVPAPMRLVRPAASPFTPSSFSGLSFYRDWCGNVDSSIQQPVFQEFLKQEDGRKGHRKLEPELISWGLFLYLIITRDGLLSIKHLNTLPLSTTTLAAHKASAWLLLHDAVPDDMTGKVPPLTRWLLGVPSLAVLMRHIECFGHPFEHGGSYRQAVPFTQKAWRHFCRASGVDTMPLSTCLEYSETAFRLQLPGYLVSSLRGKHMGTSIAEERWQQLLCGGYIKHAKPEVDQNKSEAPVEEASQPLTSMEQYKRNQPLYEGRALLKSLHQSLYKRRDHKRLSFEAVSQELKRCIGEAQRMAPIVECLCRWLLFLHLKKKRKQSTLYKYLSVSMPLLQAMGDTPVDQDRLAMLVEAYQYVVEQAKTDKNRGYRWAVLSSFHSFLVAELGLASVTMEFVGGGATVTRHADANCLSEEEFCLVADHLATRSTALGQVRYWIFVLGFRAGLRIGEALSIQLCDVLLFDGSHETEVTLLIRNNAYVGTKSYDSRRQLPLHHLLTESELNGFKYFVVNRQAIARHRRVMLFGEGGDSVAPLRDDRVQAEIHDTMRRITGDPGLRFHHLRHSLANYLLLSFHGVKMPWATPSHHTELWQKVTGGPSRSGLYFIAQVMGHSSPDVTLRSYIHFTCLLGAHYCRRKPGLVEKDNLRHAIAQIESLKGIVEIKPATLRKWKERFGMRPPLWLGRAYPQCQMLDVSQRSVEPYPSLPESHLPERQGLSELSLEQVEAALNSLHHRDGKDVERIFNLRMGEAESLISCAKRVLTARTRRGKSAFLHHRITAGKQQTPSLNGVPRLSIPHALTERQIAYAMYRAIWHQWFEHRPDLLRSHLRFFYRFHRSVDGHVWIRDVDNGLAFVSWVLSLDAGIRAVIEVTPSALSELSSKQQLKGWKDKLPSHKHKVEWEEAKAGRRFRKELGTGNVKFYAVNKNKKMRSGYPVRYALVVTCIVMAALANKQSSSQ